MAEKVEDERSGTKKDAFKIWLENYTEMSKAWENSYSELYKHWIESTGKMFEKAAELSKEAAPQKYKEFYDEWTKTYQNTFGKFYPIPTLESNKEILEKFLVSAEESNKIYKSWIAELEDNSQKTKEILQGEPDPAKYKEYCDMWIKSYEKIFDQFLTLPSIESTKNIFENYTGIPDIYLANFVQMAKLWRNTYIKIYSPWIESLQKLSTKMTDISKGDTEPETYKEFYTIWMDTYNEIYSKYAIPAQPSKEIFDSFIQSTNIYLDMYKSWIAALEKMSKKAEELSKQTADPETYKEFYNLWIKMYEKAFDSFFEDMPVAGPMKELMEPMKNMAKVYTDIFIRMPKMWIK